MLVFNYHVNMLKKIIWGFLCLFEYTVTTHHSFIGFLLIKDSQFVKIKLHFKVLWASVWTNFPNQNQIQVPFLFNVLESIKPPHIYKSSTECVLFQIAGEESSFAHRSPEPWFSPTESCFQQGSCGKPVCESGICDSDFSSPCQLQKVKQMFPRLLQRSSSLIPRGKSEEAGDKHNSVSQATRKWR